MDQLRKCMDVLRHLAKAEPNRQVLAEERINEYLQEEVVVLRASLELLRKAIAEEAEKGQGKDWSLIQAYVQSCFDKLPGAIESWRKDFGAKD
jgi:hypothetical protein